MHAAAMKRHTDIAFAFASKREVCLRSEGMPLHQVLVQVNKASMQPTTTAQIVALTFVLFHQLHSSGIRSNISITDILLIATSLATP